MPPSPPKTGADVMAQFIPSSPFVAKLGIVAEVLDADEVRLRLPWDPSNVTLGDMVHGGAIAHSPMSRSWPPPGRAPRFRTRCAA
jgi:acyl-coenzyme A thioesterase PaaI-like protein